MTAELLVGREHEQGVIARLLEGVRDHGGALVVVGEAGVGKSALLTAAAEMAGHRDLLVLSTAGVRRALALYGHQMPADQELRWLWLACIAALHLWARAGQPARAAVPLRYLTEVTTAAATDWALGIQARCQGLLGQGEPAEACYLEAIEWLGRTRIRLELARAHLVYGEWLRRDNRRVDARAQLRAAHQMFTAMQANGFADRARRELLATGETVRTRTVDTRDQLTAQERQVARRARDGYSNTEIGAELFLSPRTVEWHLRKVFTKLGINSRRQLREALPDLSQLALPA